MSAVLSEPGGSNGSLSCAILELATLDATPLDAGGLEWIRFDANRFEPRDFERAGMPCPPAIARSVTKRQAEYYCGRIAARRALAACGEQARDIAAGPHREPLWPPGLVGSITHTGDCAAAVVRRRGRLRGIGIDLEHVPAADGLDALRAVALDAHEIDLLAHAAHALPAATLATIMFSAKESFYKAVFPVVGRFLDFGAVRVVAVRPQDGRLTLRVAEDLHEALRAGQCLDAGFRRMSPGLVLTSLSW